MNYLSYLIELNRVEEINGNYKIIQPSFVSEKLEREESTNELELKKRVNEYYEWEDKFKYL